MTSERRSVWTGIVVVAILVMIVFIAGMSINHNLWQRRAVREGHAQWVATENGDAVFQWNVPCDGRK